MQRIRVCLAQLDRAFGYGPKGRGFESSNTRFESTLRDQGAFLISPGFFMKRMHKAQSKNTAGQRTIRNGLPDIRPTKCFHSDGKRTIQVSILHFILLYQPKEIRYNISKDTDM